MLHPPARASALLAYFVATLWPILGGPIYASGPLRLRVMSYNIHHGEGMDGKVDLPRLAGVIRAESPDLVSLQEVDQKTERTGKVDQPAETPTPHRHECHFREIFPIRGPLWERHPLPISRKVEAEPSPEIVLQRRATRGDGGRGRGSGIADTPPVLCDPSRLSEWRSGRPESRSRITGLSSCRSRMGRPS